MVSTAETLALVDTIKGIEMFDKVAIPVLGLVENMAQHICSSCGHKSQLFNASDMTAIAERYKTTVLGNIAFSAKLQQKADPEFMQATYGSAARKLAARVALQAPCYGVHFVESDNKPGKGEQGGN